MADKKLLGKTGGLNVFAVRSGSNVNIKIEGDEQELVTHPMSKFLRPKKGEQNPTHIQYPATKLLRSAFEEWFGWGDTRAVSRKKKE